MVVGLSATPVRVRQRRVRRGRHKRVLLHRASAVDVYQVFSLSICGQYYCSQHVMSVKCNEKKNADKLI